MTQQKRIRRNYPEDLKREVVALVNRALIQDHRCSQRSGYPVGHTKRWKRGFAGVGMQGVDCSYHSCAGGWSMERFTNSMTSSRAGDYLASPLTFTLFMPCTSQCVRHERCVHPSVPGVRLSWVQTPSVPGYPVQDPRLVRSRSTPGRLAPGGTKHAQ